MKKFILFFLLLASAAMVHAQKVYFVYIQTESPTPFFVKTGDKVLSSTSQGYIIIPSLHDSTYIFSIGMPALAEKKFRVTVSHNDRGFLLKDFNGSWSLFDLQSMAVINAEPELKQPEPLAVRSDEFSRKLALAVDDPSLLFVYAKVETAPVLVKKEVPAEPAKTSSGDVIQTTTVASQPAGNADDSIIQTVASSTSNTEAEVSDSVALVTISPAAKEEKRDSATSAETGRELQVNQDMTAVIIEVDTVNTIAQPAADTTMISKEPVFQRSKVTRKSESSTTEGFGLVFLDEQDGVVDTIRILIPNPRVIYKTEADLRNESELASGTKVPEKEVRTLPATQDTVVVAPVDPACPGLATEADFKKLRKDMVSKDSDEEMVERAKKVFKTKCFTTAQVKLLGALFLTPGGRYSFFDAAYGHVSDPSEFGSLRSELSNDEYYLKRFKALIGEL